MQAASDEIWTQLIDFIFYAPQNSVVEITY